MSPEPVDDATRTRPRGGAAGAPATPDGAEGSTTSRAELHQGGRRRRGGRSKEAAEVAATGASSPTGSSAAGSPRARRSGSGDPRRPGRDAQERAEHMVRGRESRRRPALPTVTLPRFQMPQQVTDTVTGARRRLGPRVDAVRERTRPGWQPVVGVLRWISPLGWAIGLVGVLAWWAGARWQWVELTMIAAACLALLIACVLLAIGRTRVRISTLVDPQRVTVGEPATGRIEVENLASIPLLPLVVELPVGSSAARFTLPSLRSSEAHEEIFVVPTARRGVIPVGPATTVQGDPFGLVRRTLRWTDRTELYVHPRTLALDSHSHGLLRDLEGQTTQDLSSSDLAFHALREYQPGDDRRHVHWRSTAKAGRLLVRQFLDTRRSHVAVVVDTSAQQYTSGADGVEMAIEVAASLMVRSILDEQEGTVVCNDQHASRTTAPLLLDTLARATVAPVDLFTSTAEAAALAPDASVAVVVTGARRPFVEGQRALGQFEVEVGKVLLVVDEHARPSVQRVSGVAILTISRLEDLRRVLLSGVAA